MALAGGVAISATRKSGYMYTEGGIMSPDGRCRAFDTKAQGSVGDRIIISKRTSKEKDVYGRAIDDDSR